MVLLKRKRRIPLRAGDIMSQPVLTIKPDSTLQEASDKMLENHVGSLVVVDDEGRVKGILTERDILFACAKGWNCNNRRVWEVMTENPVTVRENDNIIDVIRKMRDLGIRHIPVVDDEGKPVGLISARDILDAVLTMLFAAI